MGKGHKRSKFRKKKVNKNSEKLTGFLTPNDLIGAEVGIVGFCYRVVVPGFGPVCVTRDGQRRVFDEKGGSIGEKSENIIIQFLEKESFGLRKERRPIYNF